MSNLKKLETFVRFLLDIKTKKQFKSVLFTLTAAQNLVLREIIYNITQRFPNRYKRLSKKVYKPLSVHFLKTHWENLWKFLQEHSEYILDHVNEESSSASV